MVSLSISIKNHTENFFLNKEGNVILRSNFILSNILTERSSNINFGIRQNIYPQLLQVFKFNLPDFEIRIFAQIKLIMDVQIMTKFTFLKTNCIHKETLSLNALIDYLKSILKVMILFNFK